MILRLVALDYPADLEQRDIGKAAVRILLRAGHETGIRLGRMSERSAAIGLASASFACPPPKSSACALPMNDHVTASTMARLASARLARRFRTCKGVRIGLRASSPRGNGVNRHLVDADDAHDLLDNVGLAFDVGTPRRHRDLHGLA